MNERHDAHRETYREEAFELLSELEEALLNLEEQQEDVDLISRIFRALHTIKGSGAMFGFDDIAAFTHDIENVFDMVRNGQLCVTKALIDLTLSAKDHIMKLLAASETGEFVDDSLGEGILESFRLMLPAAEAEAAPSVTVATPPTKTPPAASAAAPKGSVPSGSDVKKEQPASALSSSSSSINAPELQPQSVPAVAEGQLLTYRIRYTPQEDIFQTGTNPLYILEDIKQLGKCFIIAQLSGIPELDVIDPERCYTYWDVILTTSRPYEDILDIFMFQDEQTYQINLIDDGGALSEDDGYKRLGEILIERGTVSSLDLDQVIGRQKRIGEILVDSGIVEARQVESALVEQQHVQELRRDRRQRDMAQTIRVPSDKLDKLVDLVGELVTVQARLTQISTERRQDSVIVSIAEEVERLSNELHDSTMSIRMVPIGTTFTKFRRLVRDLSVELGRDVLFETIGGETELDKTVIERLNDPLVHLIRNSLDHGIEPLMERESVGKSRQGVIRLSAAHVGSDVRITITDDGAGMDPAVIHAKAIEKGLVSPTEELSEHEIFAQIFAPGFTTAKKVTDVSGRGVGMDVVRRSIDSLRGSIEVQSKRGQGTTISLKIPLTLAIIDGLLVRVGQGFYVIPLSQVEECVELGQRQRREAHDRHLVNVRGTMVPYISLRERFAINGKRPELEQIVILNYGDMTVGFSVDAVVGEHQTVIKSLSRVYRNVTGISGATILGNGTVALILDVANIITEAELEESESYG